MEKKLAFQPHKVSTLRPLGDTIIAHHMEFDHRTLSSGIVLLNDNMKSSGIRPRWCQVYAIGPEQKDVEVGQYIMVSHGRWSRGVIIEDSTGEKTIRKIDPNDILLVSDTLPTDDTLSDKI